jgi:GAF domain-containing protein/anti-sigma regulatory factor (Ser/Thr protein kinase)
MARRRSHPALAKLALARKERKEALEQQAATAAILRIISSSPRDLAPVFDAILRSALRLCEANLGLLNLYDGERYRTVAQRGATGEFARYVFERGAFEPEGGLARATAERRPVHIPDLLRAPSYRARRPNAVKFVELGRARTAVSVPLVKGRQVVGALVIYRSEPRPFTERQIAIVSLFANQAVIAIENARLFNETKEALERQTATAAILKVISSSPSDLNPVFDSILENATRLCDAHLGILNLRESGKIRAVAQRGASPEYARWLAERGAIEPSGSLARVYQERRPIQTADLTKSRGYLAGNPFAVKLVEVSGARTFLMVPLVMKGEAIGNIGIYRREVRPFTDKQIALLGTFADQAVIAIENARLFNETRDALERQTATADILKVISGSPTDVQPVFHAVAERAAQLCNAMHASVLIADGEVLRVMARVGRDLPFAEIPIRRTLIHGRAFLERRTVHVEDVVPLLDSEYPDARENQRKSGFRSFLSVPMTREGTAIGTIGIWRDEVKPFSKAQIELLETFAAQAVIAIENVRLFNETREALEQQTATAEILRVISSSPTDVQPVFDAIAERAAILCGAKFANVTTFDGEWIHLRSAYGPRAEEHRGLYPMRPGGGAVSARVIQDRAPVQIEDVLKDPEYAPKEAATETGYRSGFGVPMMRDGRVVGGIALARQEPGPIPQRLMRLLQTFADQAVIAIENVRLFNETKEALEQQTAISEVLRVISDSPTDVKPVLDAVAVRAAKICEASDARIWLVEDASMRHVAGFGDVPMPVELDESLPLDRGTVSGRAILERAPVHVEDMAELTREDYPISREMQERSGFRTILSVPLMREQRALGAIMLRRLEVRSFSDKQIALLKTFADQAAIAIENVRLFNETKEALERQKASAEILRVISGSLEDTSPVFEAIVASGARLYEAHQVGINVLGPDGRVALRAYHGPNREEFEAYMSDESRRAAGGGLRLKRRLAHFLDVEAGAGVPEQIRGGCRITGTKAIIYAPMISGGKGIGAIWVGRDRVGPFSDKEITLLQTFADQAVIAIQNARLFGDTKEALERQTATADILRVISSTPTDTRPVFDAIVEATQRLIAGQRAVILLRREGYFSAVAKSGGGLERIPQNVRNVPLDRDKNFPSRAILDGEVVHIPDWQADDVPEFEKNVGKAYGVNSGVIVPLLRQGEGIGALAVARTMAGPYHEKEITLLRSFADQAVIAIENVRLFKELQQRTEALTKSVGQLTALGEVGQAISSTLDLETVLKTIVARAVQLTGLDAGAIYEYDESREEFHLRAAENMSEDIIELLRKTPIKRGDGAVGGTAVAREPVQIPEIQDESYKSRFREVLIRTGRRALLAVPLMREEHIIGALAVQRNTPGPFATEIVELLKTFATQSAMAIQNARLFREIAEKGRQLEVASQHKSQFLASMSHELRTPLNALLGFNEMLLGDIYGEVPGDMRPPLAQMQSSGKHLLRLINNVLDLAKIEAGRMELALADYSVQDTVESVRSTLQPLAADKGLEFVAAVPADIPLAYGDPGRITQCLMNLAGNSLKFTKAGKVEISVTMSDGQLRYCVADTGIGIPSDKIDGLFTEFKQTDATVASEYGGTGLGLSISKKFVEMHGGRIWAQSEPGRGSAFTFEVPLRAKTA